MTCACEHELITQSRTNLLAPLSSKNQGFCGFIDGLQFIRMLSPSLGTANEV